MVNRKDGTELAIKKAKIREIESEGMLASPEELGLEPTQEDGILDLPEDAKLGESIIKYLSLQKDKVLEVASRSNRGDALSVYGLAKEMSALTDKKLKKLSFEESEFDLNITPTSCSIENPEDTFLFYTATIKNIEVKKSPIWLIRLLNSVGIRSINNIVDITNYINISFGQPMHAYDKSKLRGNLISRRARNNEKITTLDGKTRTLKEGVLVIADNSSPVAIAGIMGSKDTEVINSTTEIVLEAAVFNPPKVRKDSREIGLLTDSSKRFERWVDSNFTYKALLKALELIQELAKPDKNNEKVKTAKIQQAGAPIKKNIKIIITPEEVKRVLNINISQNEIIKILSSLEFICRKIDMKNIEVDIPSTRINDVAREIDLIEEIARLYGYDQINSEPPKSTIAASKSISYKEIIKKHFIASGFSEAYLSSLIGEQILSYKEFYFDSSKSVWMMNPVSREHSVLRQSLLPGLLEALKQNQNHQIDDIKLFEIGKVYFYTGLTPKGTSETQVIEKEVVSGVVFGHDKNWHIKKIETLNEYLFFWTKGVIEGLLLLNLVDNAPAFSFELNSEKFLHPGFSLKINFNNICIGTLGCLHPEIENSHELSGPVIVFEICLEYLLPQFKIHLENKRFKKISTQPVVERDITIDISKKFHASEVQDRISNILSSFVVSTCLISTFDLDKDTRSLTFRLKMQDLERTLTSKEVDDEVNKVINNLTSCFQAKFRV